MCAFVRFATCSTSYLCAPEKKRERELERVWLQGLQLLLQAVAMSPLFSSSPDRESTSYLPCLPPVVNRHSCWQTERQCLYLALLDVSLQLVGGESRREMLFARALQALPPMLCFATPVCQHVASVVRPTERGDRIGIFRFSYCYHLYLWLYLFCIVLIFVKICWNYRALCLELFELCGNHG